MEEHFLQKYKCLLFLAFKLVWSTWNDFQKNFVLQSRKLVLLNHSIRFVWRDWIQKVQKEMFPWFNLKVWGVKNFRTFFFLVDVFGFNWSRVPAVISADDNRFSSCRYLQQKKSKVWSWFANRVPSRSGAFVFGTTFQRDSGIQVFSFVVWKCIRRLNELDLLFQRGDYCRKSSFPHMCRCAETHSCFVPTSLRERRTSKTKPGSRNGSN